MAEAIKKPEQDSHEVMKRIYDALDPENYGLMRYPTPEQGQGDKLGDEGYAEAIAFGNDQRDNEENAILFAIRLGRALASHERGKDA